MKLHRWDKRKSGKCYVTSNLILKNVVYLWYLIHIPLAFLIVLEMFFCKININTYVQTIVASGNHPLPLTKLGYCLYSLVQSENHLLYSSSFHVFQFPFGALDIISYLFSTLLATFTCVELKNKSVHAKAFQEPSYGK